MARIGLARCSFGTARQFWPFAFSHKRKTPFQIATPFHFPLHLGWLAEAKLLHWQNARWYFVFTFCRPLGPYIFWCPSGIVVVVRHFDFTRRKQAKQKFPETSKFRKHWIPQIMIHRRHPPWRYIHILSRKNLQEYCPKYVSNPSAPTRVPLHCKTGLRHRWSGSNAK